MASPLPQDLHHAIEQWRVMDERLAAFRGLGEVLRVCAEVHTRVAQAEERLRTIGESLADYETKRDELAQITTALAERRASLQRVNAECQQAEHRLTRLRERLRVAAEGALHGDDVL